MPPLACSPPAEDWFTEPPVAGYEQRYRVRRRLQAERTAWQKLEVLELEGFGHTLLLDGALQTSVGDEFAYHEMLVHIPMCTHPNPRRILVIGGGDGGTLRHVLLHPGVERVVQVELDQCVIDASLKYLPEISRGAYEDARVELRVGDGVAYVEATDERFDVILVDSTDPVGPAAALLKPAFLQAAGRALAPGGIMAMQSGSPLTQPVEWTRTVAAFRGAFPIVRPYLGWVLLYPGVVWSWVTGSAELDPTSLDDIAVNARLEQFSESLRLYNTSVHRAAFALPNFLQTLLSHDRPITHADLQAAGHPLPGILARG